MCYKKTVIDMSVPLDEISISIFFILDMKRMEFNLIYSVLEFLPDFLRL